MLKPDFYFLTESVSLESQQLIQRGISLDLDHPMFEYKGAYTGEKHFAWADLRRRRCRKRGWLAKDIHDYGADIKMALKEHLSFPPEIMEIVWDKTDSPTGTPLNQIEINEKQSAIISLEIQLPALSWLHENELIRIAALQKELHPDRENPDGKILWDHAVFCQRIITGWFIRNKIPPPLIDYPELKLTDWDRFCLLVEEAVRIKSPSDEQLKRWRDAFDEFPPSYFPRYEKRLKKEKKPSLLQGPDSGNALEWRKNPKFRLKRGTKSKQ